MKRLKIRAGLALCAGALCVMISFSSPARAQCSDASAIVDGIAKTPCDCNVWESMKSYSEMAAQREIEVNQNLISKPDSVLEYTCFDRQINGITDNYSDMFSGSSFLGDLISNLFSMFDLSDLFDNLIMSFLSDYLNLNFGHPFLGGRAPDDYTMGGSGNCDTMSRVWDHAKSYNFATEPTDGFFSFAELANMPDIRIFPVPSAKDARWSNWIVNAIQDPPYFSGMEQNVNKVFDQVREALMPGGSCKTIETGVMVRSYGRSFNEVICPNPGCVPVQGVCQ